MRVHKAVLLFGFLLVSVVLIAFNHPPTDLRHWKRGSSGRASRGGDDGFQPSSARLDEVCEEAKRIAEGYIHPWLLEGVTEDDLSTALSMEQARIRFVVKDRKFYLHSVNPHLKERMDVLRGHAADWYTQLQQYDDFQPLPDMDMVLDFFDEPSAMIGERVFPVFAPTSTFRHSNIPIMLLEHYQYLQDPHENYNDRTWESKEPVAFWRGHCTGGTPQWQPRDRNVHWTPQNWRSKARVILADISKKNPELVDAKFVKYSEPEMHQYFGPPAPRINFQDHARYKYLVDVDGNSWSSRFTRLLFFNAVVFKQYPFLYEEYLNEMLVPGVHFMPIKRDFSDLLEKVQYARAHDDEMKRISRAARTRIHEVVNNRVVMCYAAHLFQLYASTLRFKVEKPPSANPLTSRDDIANFKAG
eukprot:gnl/Spiro4/15498_TR8349_c0_g1_i1.p1 gnl/Spiro4/15498_TR8349_c0_g1~~gnl/Spiro4/15498_TR8349_c0_g1_i1.p1  ORF type:complete len:414 (+),score=59.53 gnl/Spiro4/15498_TR8349_c0_g1_i1:33-1274(+)